MSSTRAKVIWAIAGFVFVSTIAAVAAGPLLSNVEQSEYRVEVLTRPGLKTENRQKIKRQPCFASHHAMFQTAGDFSLKRNVFDTHKSCGGSPVYRFDLGWRE